MVTGEGGPFAGLDRFEARKQVKAKIKAQAIQCLNNTKQIALGFTMYAGDNGDFFPSPPDWWEASL